jgi:hypothetical protein
MTQSLALVLQATFVSETGFGADSAIFRTVAPNEGQIRSTNGLATNETVTFDVGTGYTLTQFVLAGPRTGLLVDMQVVRNADPAETIRLKAGGLVCLNDPDVRSIAVTNTGETTAQINVLISRERTT